MNPTAIYSKSGKGVQEASGKTSHLARADRAVLSAIDGRLTVKEVAERVGRSFDAKFEQLVQKLDSEGFIRQVSSGSAAMAAPPARPASGAAKPGGKPSGEDLDFTVIMPAPVLKPAPPPAAPAAAIGGEAAAKAQAAAFAKAREEAEIKAQKERDRLKAEAEAKFRAEQETKLRSEAEVRAKEEAAARIKAEAEAKIKAAREAAVRAAAEAKAQAEAERQAREAAERKAREEAERVRREAEELRQRLEAERKAREEAERKAREEAERARREAEERARREAEEKARREAEELRQRLEAERQAREAAERKAREEAERARKEAEEKARREAEALRQRLEAEHQAREAAERKAREEADRARKEAEEQARQEAEQARREAEELRGRLEAERREREQEDARRAQEREREEGERKERQAREAEQARAKAAAARPRTGDKFADSLMDDLDSFTQRDEDERKEKEAAERKAKEETQLRAKQEAERQAREEKERAERERQERAEREVEDRKRKEEESRKAREREEEVRREREEKERAEREAEERRRRREARAKTESAGEDEDDLVVSEDDLDMDDVKQDQAVLTEDARRAAKEREKREKEARREAKREAARRAKEEKRKEKAQERPAAVAPAYQPIRRRRSWGKPIAITLFLVLAAGIGALHVMPIATAEYEQAASQALGRPVTIGAARLSLYSGVQLNLSNVSVGEVKVPAVRAFPAIGSLFGPQKSFSRLELEGATLPQQALGALFGARIRAENFAVERIYAKGLKLTGPVKLPALDAELAFGSDGSITSTTVRGPEGLQGKIVPNGKGVDFDIVANSFAVPIFPDVWLSGFAMKGSATPEGMQIREWGGGSLDGGISGTASVRWGSNWVIDGVVTVRGINAAVFAPALLSEGHAEGTAKFFLNDPDPMNFLSRGRLEGNFSVHKGVLGSFDLSRAIQTGGRQAGGRTPFTGMNGHGVFDRGAVALRNVSFGAGAMNAGASADIGADGKLSGRIVADVSTSSQTLRATLNLGGTVRDPQVKH
jgi:hypothetical protein